MNEPRRSPGQVAWLSSGTPTGENADATVSAAGYRHTKRGWKLIASKQLVLVRDERLQPQVTQTRPGPSGSPAAVQWDSVTVSLLWGRAIGCLPSITRHWR
jgi:hypothetical protein